MQPGVRGTGCRNDAVAGAFWAEGSWKRTPHGETPSSVWTEGSVCRTRGQVATSRGTFNISAGICAKFFITGEDSKDFDGAGRIDSCFCVLGEFGSILR